MKQKTILIVIIALFLSSCNEVQPSYPMIIKGIDKEDLTRHLCRYEITPLDGSWYGFNKTNVYIIDSCGKYTIGDTLKTVKI